jgi:putative ABC transport system substrate-binding protein
VSELLPKAKKIAVLMNSNASGVSDVTIRLAQQAVNAKGMGLMILEAGDDNALELAFAAIARERADALVVSADAFFFLRREQITALAARYVVPTIYELQGFVDAGGLISYGPDVAALRRQVGIYTGRLLKGVKLADLPIQQPTKFDLALNLKTAKGLGLIVPPSVLTRADVVIE